MNDNWKNALQAIAPSIAAAIGLGIGGPAGPLVGAALTAAAKSLSVGGRRVEASEEDVSAAVQAGLSGEQILSLKQEDNRFKEQMAQIEKDTELAYLTDVQNARARQVETKDNMPQVILCVLFVLWFITFCLFVFVPLPPDEFVRALIVRAYATVETGLTGAIAYFIGSSRGSKRSSDSLRAIAEQSSSAK